MDLPALWLSLRLAAITTLLLFVVGVPIAYWLASTRSRFKPVVEALVALPIVLPPTVLGFFLLLSMGSNGPLGQLSEGVFGRPLAFTFEALVIASVLYSLPFAVQPIAVAFAAVDRGLIEASWTLGTSRLRTFARIMVPLSRGGLIAGGVLAFAHTLGEFGVVLMVGGNIPGVTRTLSMAIYDDVQALDYGSATLTAVFLLVVSFFALVLTYAGQGRVAAAWRTT